METEDGSRLRSEVREPRTEVRIGRDTTMCGDPNLWFPMRVTYAREMNDVPDRGITESRRGGITEGVGACYQ